MFPLNRKGIKGTRSLVLGIKLLSEVDDFFLETSMLLWVFDWFL